MGYVCNYTAVSYRGVNLCIRDTREPTDRYREAMERSTYPLPRVFGLARLEANYKLQTNWGIRADVTAYV